VSNDFNWPNAVAEAGNDTGWIALGHMLHLLEDIAVPAHTRNDPHPSYEPLEEETANLFPVLPGGPLISVSSPQDLFQQLRAYTQSRYFSNDTCFHPDFPGPAAAREDNDYFYDAEGRKIAHKSITYRWTGNRRRCTIDPIIAQEQYAELGPIAVRYGASLIKYYSNQTNMPCPASKNQSTLYAGSMETLYAYDGKLWTTSDIPTLTGIMPFYMAVYNGKLYVVGINAAFEGQAYVLNGESWSLSHNFGQYNYPQALIVHDSKLYIAISNWVDLLGSIYFYDGVSWTESLAPTDDLLPMNFAENAGTLYAGGYDYSPGLGYGVVFSLSAGSWSQLWIVDSWDTPRAMASYNGDLYVGTGNVGYVYKYDGASWTESYSVSEGPITSLSVYDGALYAGGEYDEEFNYGRVFKFDGSSWTTSLSLSPSGSFISGLSVYGKKLYAGANHPGKIYVYDGSNWEIAFDPHESYLGIMGTIDLTPNP